MEGKILRVKVIPNSKSNKIVEQKNNFLKIKLTAPAHEGKANKALISFLSQTLKIPKNKIQIISGEKAREKKVLLI
jgi:uncharacterized protein (TIGR00251 family)